MKDLVPGMPMQRLRHSAQQNAGLTDRFPRHLRAHLMIYNSISLLGVEELLY